MARRSPGDRPGQPANKTIKPVKQDKTSASGGVADEQTLAEVDQALSDSDQTLAESNQTGGERDQTSADRDQAASDRDQAASDRDQAASDRDQAASDRDLARGGDPREHDASREIRLRTTREREQTTAARLVGALLRDVVIGAQERAVTGAEIVLRAAEHRRRAAEQRQRAAEQRAQAVEYREQVARDREAAAIDREQAARDRERALADREALAHALAISGVDPVVTGARARAAGMRDLDHEIDRSRRTASTLVIVYVDVVGLKRPNDSKGHDAGDRLLKRVVTAITQHLRPYDLIIRLGGDEFLCAMSNITLAEARRRLSDVASTLATGSDPAALRTGFAELTPLDTATALIARADTQLNDSRRNDHARVE